MILLNLHDFIMLENDSKCLIWWRLFSYHFCQENVSNRTKNIFGVKIQIRNYLIFEFSRQKWRKLQNWIIMVFHFDIRNSSKRSSRCSRRSHCYKMRLLGDFPTLYVIRIRIINWKKWAWKNCLLWSSSWQTKAKEEVSGFDCVNNVLWDTQHVHKHHQCKNMTILSIFFSCILDFKPQST